MSHGRVVFMGTPAFAVPVLTALCKAGFSVVGVVTQPDKPTGRKRVLTPPPISAAAASLGLPVLQPAKVRRADALQAIAAWRPDVLVTCAYGQLLPQALLDIPRVGSLNVHASLLPRWRGAAPIQRAVMAGDGETGISLMEMVAALDAGPVYGTEAITIGPNDTFGAVHDQLAEAGAQLLMRLLPAYLRGDLAAEPQAEERVTYAERIMRADEWIDWHAEAREVHNHVRGLNPWPGACTAVGDAVLKIWATALPQGDTPPLAQPGTVVQAKDRVLVACGDGWVRLLEVQPAGRRRMPVQDWVRGHQTGIQFTVPGTTTEGE